MLEAAQLLRRSRVPPVAQIPLSRPNGGGVPLNGHAPALSYRGTGQGDWGGSGHELVAGKNARGTA